MRKGNFEKTRYELVKQDWDKLLLNKNAKESYELMQGFLTHSAKNIFRSVRRGKRRQT